MLQTASHLALVSPKANKELIREPKYFLESFLVSFPGKTGEVNTPPAQTWDHEPLVVHVAMGGKGMQGLDS